MNTSTITPARLTTVLKSRQDESINFIFDNGLEARYVRREDDKVLVYLSSHYGCDKACRFCHLTQTGQTDMTSSTVEDYLLQAKVVLDHYASITDRPKATYVNFNFMARGEPLANETLLTNGVETLRQLRKLADTYRLYPIFNISTILPTSFEGKRLVDTLGVEGDVRIYYSAYSTDTEFRKRWLPKAMSIASAAKVLSDWTMDSLGTVVIHHALIEGENDNPDDLTRIYNDIVSKSSTPNKYRFNLVRYNPYSPNQGEEPSESVIDAYLAQARKLFGENNVQDVPRVGMDVKASCGMFISP